MKLTLHRLTQRLLIAGLLALPMTFVGSPASAQSCKTGSCGGPNNLVRAIAIIDAAESTVTSGSIEAAYERIESAAQSADELNVGSNSKVRQGLGDLVKTLQNRTDEQFAAALKSYFEGYHSEALAQFEQLAALTGLPAAKKAQAELNKEDDRVAWRSANDSAAKLVGDKKYGEAREPISEMNRLARRTDYTSQTNDAMKSLGTQMMSEVDRGVELIAQEQFDIAYGMLIEISRLTHARESASAARKALGQHATLPGMRQAKGEYDGNEALTQTHAWYNQIANPSPNEQRLYQQKLQSIASSFQGTAAAEQAKQLLGTDNAQAAR